PSALGLAAGFAINVMVRRALEAEPLDPAQVRAMLALAARNHIELDVPNLNVIVDQRMTRAMLALQAAPRVPGLLEQAAAIAGAMNALPFTANIWQAQNLWYEIWHKMHTRQARRANDAVLEQTLFAELGRLLSIAPTQLAAGEWVDTVQQAPPQTAAGSSRSRRA
ncbi:MAG TPA: hypothetical protein VGD62_00665, partial [Acidobacteriaceae bacterium]